MTPEQREKNRLRSERWRRAHADSVFWLMAAPNRCLIEE